MYQQTTQRPYYVVNQQEYSSYKAGEKFGETLGGILIVCLCVWAFFKFAGNANNTQK